MLPSNHQEHADRAPETEDVLHSGGNLRERLISPGVSKAVPFLYPPAVADIATAGVSFPCMRRIRLRVVVDVDDVLNSKVHVRRLIGHDVEADDGSEAVGDDGNLPAPRPARFFYSSDDAPPPNNIKKPTVVFTVSFELSDKGAKCCCCCCFLTLTDPLRIQPWSQDRRNQTKSNRESEMSMESIQKRTGKK